MSRNAGPKLVVQWAEFSQNPRLLGSRFACCANAAPIMNVQKTPETINTTNLDFIESSPFPPDRPDAQSPGINHLSLARSTPRSVALTDIEICVQSTSRSFTLADSPKG